MEKPFLRKIPAVKKLPMPGAQWHKKVSCWLCLQRKSSSSLALSENQVSLAIKKCKAHPWERWALIRGEAPNSSGVKHHPPSVLWYRFIRLWILHLLAVVVHRCHSAYDCALERGGSCTWMLLNSYPCILFYAFATNTVAAWISC